MLDMLLHGGDYVREENLAELYSGTRRDRDKIESDRTSLHNRIR